MKLKHGLILSFAAHVFLGLCLFLQVVFFPDVVFDLQQAVRVDLVDLPDKSLSEKLPEKYEPPQEQNNIPDPPQSELPEKVVAPQKNDDVKVTKSDPIKNVTNKKSDLEKLKSKQKNAINKLKTRSAIENLKNEVSQDAKKNTFKGRILSAGSALAGLDRLQSDGYLAQLDTRIKSNWSLPNWLIGKNLRTRILIKFDQKGNLVFKQITQSSGNQTYDEYCMQSIERSIPFPAVPEKFSLIYRLDGITIGFPD